MIICPHCGTIFGNSAYKCPDCSYEIHPKDKAFQCNKCGQFLGKASDSCQCGGWAKAVIDNVEYIQIPQEVEPDITEKIYYSLFHRHGWHWF